MPTVLSMQTNTQDRRGLVEDQSTQRQGYLAVDKRLICARTVVMNETPRAPAIGAPGEWGVG